MTTPNWRAFRRMIWNGGVEASVRDGTGESRPSSGGASNPDSAAKANEIDSEDAPAA